ncbi:hypothetical protein ACHAXR_005384 [Thalassiosira sp. AJA248-18]
MNNQLEESTTHNPAYSNADQPGAAALLALAAAPRATTVPAAETPARAVQTIFTTVASRVGGAIAALSPLRPGVVGTSPFNESVAGSTLTSTSSSSPRSSTTSNSAESEDHIKAIAHLEYTERGDGGDSDEEGEEVNEHFDALVASRLERGNGDQDNDIDEDDQGEVFSAAPRIEGAPDKWVPPQPPDDWMGYVPKYDAPATFAEIDNPGGWSDYTYRAKYKAGKYVGCATPAGATVVPKNSNGERELNGWNFYYDGWEPSEFSRETYVRGTAKRGDIKPSDRKGCLDVDVLKQHGMTADRAKNDPLFIFQLLLPMCDPKRSGINGDRRMPYFTTVRAHTNTYATGEKGWGGGYGHKYELVDEATLVRWTAVPIRHGAREGKPGSIHNRWIRDDCEYDSLIADSMTMSRWRQIKAVFKLNNNLAAPKRGQEGYDPCSKYDFIFKTVVHNMNNLTKQAEKDAALDESTWGFGGYMADTGGRLKNKPVGKGGQTTMIFDVTRRYPRAYIHRHKVHQRPVVGFNAEGPSEIYALLNDIDDLIQGRRTNDESSFTVPNEFICGDASTYAKKKIYQSPPHITADNHFSGEHVLDLAGGKGYGLTMTTRRDRYPRGLKPYLHHEKVLPGDKKAKVMKYENPIFAVKEEQATPTTTAFTKTHVSFQSTGATNISGVNNLPSLSLYVTTKERGRGSKKRVWGIEQNEGRDTYLQHYYGIDNVDHMIKIAMIRYITWKYWHAPYLHALSIAVIAAYDMYHEIVEGGLDEEWFVPAKDRMSFRKFRLLLSKQMLMYDPKKEKYPGDAQFRSVTQQHKERRARKAVPYARGGVTMENFKKAKTADVTRLCGVLGPLEEHFASIKPTKGRHSGNCDVCGNKTMYKCDLCEKFVCILEKRKWTGGTCATKLHNDSYFGLTRSDHQHLHGKAMKDWKAPSTSTIRRNARNIETLSEMLEIGGDEEI